MIGGVVDKRGDGIEGVGSAGKDTAVGPVNDVVGGTAVVGVGPCEGKLIGIVFCHMEASDRKAAHVGGKNVELELVLHAKTAVGSVGGAHGTVVGAVAVDIHGAVGGAAEDTAGKAAAPRKVAVDDEAKVADTVVRERGVQGDGRPLAGREGDVALEHQVTGCDREPVGCTGEFRLVSVDHVDLHKRSLLRATIVESNAGDGTSHGDFCRSVDLLRQGVVVKGVDWQIRVCGCTTVANRHRYLCPRCPRHE